MFEAVPDQINWLAGQVADAGDTLRESTRLDVVSRGAFGDTAGGTACAGATQRTATATDTARDRLCTTLKSDVDGLRGVAANYAETDGGNAERIDSIDVYTTHVSGGQAHQIAGAWDVVGESQGRPTVFTGDLNTRLDPEECRDSDSDACDDAARAELGRYKELGFTDAGAGLGPTSDDGEGNRIDYIFTNGVDPVGTEVVDGGPSDHHGLVTELVIPEHNPWRDN